MSQFGVPGRAFSASIALDVANEIGLGVVVLDVELDVEVVPGVAPTAEACVGLCEQPATAPIAADAAVAAPTCRRRRRDSSATSKPDPAQYR